MYFARHHVGLYFFVRREDNLHFYFIFKKDAIFMQKKMSVAMPTLPFQSLRTFVAGLCLWFGLLPSAYAQFGGGGNTECLPPDSCKNLKIEIVRINDASSGCGSEVCGGTTSFTSVTYKVFLRYQPAVPPANYNNFNLQYQGIFVKANLNANGGFSYVDAKAAEKCYATTGGTKWNNNVKLTADTRSVSLDFRNTTPTGDCSAAQEQIEMQWNNLPSYLSACGGTRPCAYAELFTVVVRARPGETIRMDCDTASHYQASAGGNSCVIGCVNTGINNGGLSYYVPLPGNPGAGTPNAGLLGSLTQPAFNPNGDLHSLVKLKNNGATSIGISYLEFVVHVGSAQNFTASAFRNSGLTKIDTNTFVYYSLSYTSPLVLAAGESVVLDSIILTPPMPGNLNWQMTLAFNGPTRVISDAACTALPVAGSVLFAKNDNGNPLCNDLVAFTLSGQPNCNSTFKVRGAFERTDPSLNQLSLKNFKVRLRFQWQGTFSIPQQFAGVGGWTCKEASSIPGCITVDGNTVELYFDQGLNISLNSVNYFELDLQVTGDGCVNRVAIEQIFMQVNDPANPVTCAPALGAISGFPICPPPVHGLVADELNRGIHETRVSFTCSGCNGSFLTGSDGAYGFCPCGTCNATITPYKNTNPLNGVTTLDLALITKHILGLDSLDTPYKIIAANANGDLSVTTFDVVTLRKLILGIIDTLPVTSWRFVDKNYTFPDPSNPFVPAFPTSATIPNVGTNSNHLANFVAIKVGDVNNTANPGRPAERPLTSITWDTPTAETGQVVSIPVHYHGAVPLEAMQLGLRFDPTQLSLLTTSPGDLLSWQANCFNLSRADRGEIKAAWVFTNPEQLIQPGQVLFYLHFKVKTPIAGVQNLLRFDDTLLPNAAWRDDDREYALEYRQAGERSETANRPDASFSAACLPNPGAGAPVFRVETSTPRPARLLLFDAAGAPLHIKVWSLQSGEQTMTLSEAANLPAGVYVWKILSEGEKAQGFWIKL